MDTTPNCDVMVTREGPTTTVPPETEPGVIPSTSWALEEFLEEDFAPKEP